MGRSVPPTTLADPTIGPLEQSPSPRASRRRRVIDAVLDRRLSPAEMVVLDVACMAAAIVVSFVLRYESVEGLALAIQAAPIVILPMLVRPAVFAGAGIYERLWHYASLADFLRLGAATVIASAVAILIGYLFVVPSGAVSLAGFPASFWAIESFVTLGLVTGTRLASRATHDLHLSRKHARGAPTPAPTLLFGAGEAGSEMARAARRDPRASFRPVGFLDDNPNLHGQRIVGLPVLGSLRHLERAVASTGATQLLLTIPAASGASVRRVTNAAASAGLAVRIVPPLHELLDGSMDAYRVRQIRLEDLLRRAPATGRLPSVQPMIDGKRVLITGGGGSIGSELARQVWGLNPAHLVLVDRAESALYEIERELLDAEDQAGGAQLSVRLANVASRPVINRLMGQVRPHVVFHAAAYKHVPLMETHPSDAVQVNVGGTLAIVEAAIEAGVERFVLVSSDKAVHPTSIMGATKRVAEWIVADAAQRSGRAFVSVRFGNVLGSNGSVVPIFQGQLERGEPITITHPDMKRYFMTIPEAVWLILDAAALGRAGETFVLDMGEQVAILDLARDLARLAGKDPNSVPIQITGLRPGEKLTEELVEESEALRPTASEKVNVIVPRPAPGRLHERIRALLLLASGEHDDVIRRDLFDLVEGRESAESALSVESSIDGVLATEGAVGVLDQAPAEGWEKRSTRTDTTSGALAK